MSCENTATLVRYVGRVSIECGGGAPGSPPPPITGVKTFSSITKVGGLNMGEEGTVTVPDWGASSIISDGVRVLQPLMLQFRIPFDISTPGGDMRTIIDMFNTRSTYKYTWELLITDRAFSPMFKFKFSATDMRVFKMEDQELGQAKVGLVDTEFLPYDVDLRDCQGNVIIAGKPALSSMVLTC